MSENQKNPGANNQAGKPAIVAGNNKESKQPLVNTTTQPRTPNEKVPTTGDQPRENTAKPAGANDPNRKSTEEIQGHNNKTSTNLGDNNRSTPVASSTDKRTDAERKAAGAKP